MHARPRQACSSWRPVRRAHPADCPSPASRHLPLAGGALPDSAPHHAGPHACRRPPAPRRLAGTRPSYLAGPCSRPLAGPCCRCASPISGSGGGWQCLLVTRCCCRMPGRLPCAPPLTPAPAVLPAAARQAEEPAPIAPAPMPQPDAVLPPMGAPAPAPYPDWQVPDWELPAIPPQELPPPAEMPTVDPNNPSGGGGGGGGSGEVPPPCCIGS